MKFWSGGNFQVEYLFFFFVGWLFVNGIIWLIPMKVEMNAHFVLYRRRYEYDSFEAIAYIHEKFMHSLKIYLIVALQETWFSPSSQQQSC